VEHQGAPAQLDARHRGMCHVQAARSRAAVRVLCLRYNECTRPPGRTRYRLNSTVAIGAYIYYDEFF